MKTEFGEYFPLSEGEIRDLWKEAFFAFDTNVLLRLYRYKRNTTMEILRVLSGLGDRIWIPFQVGLEYNKHRLSKIREAEQPFHRIVNKYSTACDEAEKIYSEVGDFGIHPEEELDVSVRSLLERIRKDLSELRTQHRELQPHGRFAELHNRLGELFVGRLGIRPESSELSAIFEEGKVRYAEKRGPGWADAESKKKNGASDREIYGDLIIWKELIAKSKADGRPMIFVTEDVKEDWWLRYDGRTIGIQPDLSREFVRESGGRIHLYRIDQFLDLAKEYLAAAVSSEAVADVQAIAARDEKDVTSRGDASNIGPSDAPIDWETVQQVEWDKLKKFIDRKEFLSAAASLAASSGLTADARVVTPEEATRRVFDANMAMLMERRRVTLARIRSLRKQIGDIEELPADALSDRHKVDIAFKRRLSQVARASLRELDEAIAELETRRLIAARRGEIESETDLE